MLGLGDGKKLVQIRGSVRTIPGRALAWPNTLMHKVEPFELADKGCLGRRTILCFFLVDPMVSKGRGGGGLLQGS